LIKNEPKEYERMS